MKLHLLLIIPTLKLLGQTCISDYYNNIGSIIGCVQECVIFYY